MLSGNTKQNNYEKIISINFTSNPNLTSKNNNFDKESNKFLVDEACVENIENHSQSDGNYKIGIFRQVSNF